MDFALGAGSGEAIAMIVHHQLYGNKPTDQLTVKEKETIRGIATLASGLAGALQGGSFETAATGAAAGYNAAVNNETGGFPDDSENNYYNIKTPDNTGQGLVMSKEQTLASLAFAGIVVGGLITVGAAARCLANPACKVAAQSVGILIGIQEVANYDPKTDGAPPIVFLGVSTIEKIVVSKAVNSNLGHAAERAVERKIFATTAEAENALRILSVLATTSSDRQFLGCH